MTNKKKNRNNSNNKTVEQQQQQQPKAQEQQTSPFTRGQWNALILLSMGFSRLLQMHNAVSRTDNTTTTGNEETRMLQETENTTTTSIDELTPSNSTAVSITPVCLQYLGQDACEDDHVQWLLRVKVATSIQCAVLLLASFVLVLWKYDRQLQQLQSYLILSPLLLTFFILAVNTATTSIGGEEEQPSHVLKYGVRQESLMCMVLMAVVFPYADNMAATTTNSTTPPTYFRKKNLQSLCCMTLFLLSFMDVILPLIPVFLDKFATITADASNATTDSSRLLLLHHYYTMDSSLQQQQPPASEAALAAMSFLIQFVLVDALTNAIVFAYAWYYMEESNQRSLLFYVACLKLFEYTVQIPSLQDAAGAASSSSWTLKEDLLETKSLVALTMTFFAGISWIAPSFGWKKNLSSPATASTTATTTTAKAPPAAKSSKK